MKFDRTTNVDELIFFFDLLTKILKAHKKHKIRKYFKYIVYRWRLLFAEFEFEVLTIHKLKKWGKTVNNEKKQALNVGFGIQNVRGIVIVTYF